MPKSLWTAENIAESAAVCDEAKRRGQRGRLIDELLRLGHLYRSADKDSDHCASVLTQLRAACESYSAFEGVAKVERLGGKEGE